MQTRLVSEALASAFAERSQLSVSDWSRKNVYLDERASPFAPGYYDPDLTPYGRDIADCYLSEDWDEDHTIKSTQLGITEVILNIIRYTAAECPVNTIYAIDSREEVRKINHVRLTPSLRANAATAKALPDNEDEMGTLTLYLRAMVIYLLGSYAQAGFENKAAGLVILDELERHKVTPGQPTTVDLARQRQKTIRNRKLYSLSKPDEEDGVAWQEFLTGTRDKYFVACPGCGHEQDLVFENLRFGHCKDLAGEYDLERVRTETFYECAGCGCPIAENHKRTMLLGGKWKRTNFDKGKLAARPRKRSRQISDLYSPFPGSSWGEIACEFLGCGNNPSKLKAFRTGRLGLPAQSQSGEVKEHHILKLRGAYKRGECPVVPCLVAQTTDVQGDVQKWVKGAFMPNGDIYVLDYGHTLAMDELANDVALTSVRCLPEPAEQLLPRILLIDEGYKPTDVRDFAQRATVILPTFTSKGRGGIQVRQTVAESKLVHRGEEMIAYHYDDDAIKKELYLTSIRDVVQCMRKLETIPEDLVAAEKLKTLPRIWFPADMERSFYQELTAEKLVRDDTLKGFTKWVWVKDPTMANDFGDAVKMLKVIWHVVGAAFAETSVAQEAIQK